MRIKITAHANKAIVEMLAKHFRVSKSCVNLVHGGTGKIKTFEITEYLTFV